MFVYSGKLCCNEFEVVLMLFWNVLCIFFVVVVCMVVIVCYCILDEDVVRQVVQVVEQVVEQIDVGVFVDCFVDDFIGNVGEVDWVQLVNLLWLVYLCYEFIYVLMGLVMVELCGDCFVVSFIVIFISGGCLLFEDMGVYDVESVWCCEGDEWVCYLVMWKQLFD